MIIVTDTKIAELDESFRHLYVIKKAQDDVVLEAKRWFAGDSPYSRELRDAVQRLFDLEAQR